jgi:hypothetical protein
MTCNFGPAHEPFGCTVHHGVRLTLTATTCNRATPAPADTLREAAQAVVDDWETCDTGPAVGTHMRALRAALDTKEPDRE